ncbi:MAG: 50S ribosomal protein L29 [bacterium]|nr:50S ribosomal protein L29 [bacterium]
MKKKQLQEYKTKTSGEIEKEINDGRKKLANLQVDLAMGKVKNIQEIRGTKKAIAQLLTILNSKS